jgi:hypothetical protein
MSSPKQVAIKLKSPKTVTIVLDYVCAQNLLIALTNALQSGGGKKKKKGKDGKDGKDGKGTKG